MSTSKLPVYFLSHGGGPWPWIDGEYRSIYQVLEKSLKQLPREVGQKPKAILMISGHWEDSIFKVMSSPKPSMIYDYGGFPPHTYQIKYEAPGSPELAKKVQSLISTATGFEVELDATRGFDHGCYTPLYVAYPGADVPVVQLSLRSDYDPKAHLAIGRALASLRSEGVLIIGSGLSYHNLRAFGPKAAQPSREFDAWLQETVVNKKLSERSERLIQWESAPSARFCHPQEDHLVPLMVAVGAAENESGVLCYHETDFFGGLTVSSFRFG
jgi:aromatic ring-opening dioxygenase catalytic subunit (LigB family)